MQFATLFTLLASATMASTSAIPLHPRQTPTPAPFSLNLFYGPGLFNTNYQISFPSVPLLTWYNLGCQFDSCTSTPNHALTSVLLRRGATDLADDVTCTFYQFGTDQSTVPGQCSGDAVCVSGGTTATVALPNARCVRCTPGNECPRGI